MVTTLISYIIIFYVLFSLGDFFINFYNKVCKNSENYNILDTFILGICFVCILLSLSSLWLPSNHYILFVLIAIGTIHWIFNLKRLKRYLSTIKNFITSTTILQKILIITPFLAILVYTYIFDHFYDAEYYHYQQIRWNEEYAVVPGLGNLEDRFGFNSNYLLLSAIFTFRFLFGDSEAVYLIQSLLYACILSWITTSYIRTNYNILYAILFALFFFIIFRYGYMFGSSSTDIIPILCVLYYLAKTVLSPDWLKKQPLLACLLPVTMVTFKLSIIAFCLICLYILFHLIKEKKYKVLSFIISACFLIVCFWCIRNVIISGYLVYPVYSVDLFSFDWKMPKGTAMLQQLHIYHWAKYMFFLEIQKASGIPHGNISYTEFLGCIINLFLFLIVIISSFIMIFKFFRKKIDKSRFYLFLLMIFCIIFNLFSAPDFRFIYGYMLGCVFLLAYMYKNHIPKARKVGIYLSITILIGLLFVASNKVINAGKRIGVKFESPMDFIALYHHRNAKNLNSFEEYKMGDFIIYTTKERHDNRTFDILPATDPNGIPFEPFIGLRIQAIETIELRGSSLQDGFRTKKEYVKIINENINSYISEYLEYKGLKPYSDRTK